MQHESLPKVYQDAHGRRERLIRHHVLLPHEIIGSLYDYGKIEMVTGPVAWFKWGTFVQEHLLSLILSLTLSLSLSLSVIYRSWKERSLLSTSARFIVCGFGHTCVFSSSPLSLSLPLSPVLPYTCYLDTNSGYPFLISLESSILH